MSKFKSITIACDVPWSIASDILSDSFHQAITRPITFSLFGEQFKFWVATYTKWIRNFGFRDSSTPSMAAAIATTPRQSSISTPASLSSPTFAQHNSPQIPIPHPHRKEVVCVFVVEGTAKMQPYFATLFEAYLEPILRYALNLSTVLNRDRHQLGTKHF